MAPKSAAYVVDLIDLAMKHELLLEDLYNTFGDKIPDNARFWKSVASVEGRHARMMDALKEHANQNLLRMKPSSSLTLDDVQTSVNHLELYIHEIKNRGITARRAAVIAKEMEEGILEKEFDKQFIAETDEAAELLFRLCEETRGHSAAMDALIARKDEFTHLVHEGVATQVQVELARTLAQKEGLSIDAVLIDRFKVSPEALRTSFAAHFRTPCFDSPSANPLPEECLHPLRERYEDMKTRLYTPVASGVKEISFALANPADLPLRDELECLYPGWRAIFLVGLSEDILHHIDFLFGQDAGGTQASASQLLDQLNAQGDQRAESKDEEVVTEEDSALVKLVNLVIEEAYHKRASDIHIEPQEEEDILIRIRVDGVLHSLMGAPARYSRAILSRIKIMAGLDISERRLPQSGKIQYRRWGRLDTELRVETYPIGNHQEDAVIRILASSKPLPLENMGLTEYNMAGLKAAVSRPYGLILCVGPTGSGKTTTLHSALGHINSPERKILTVEDPVEISQRGLRQLQVNRKAGLTFGRALRSFLRSDPDVIMVGEMRDQETAQTALEASLTGHLVLSTLHTNTAPETVTRLLDMGIDPFAFADALLAVLAQRLTRRLCRECCQAVPDPAPALTKLQKNYGADKDWATLSAGANLRDAAGCDTCSNTGYRGRLALHELLTVDDAIRDLILHKGSARELRIRATADGMRSLHQDGIGKVLRGETTLVEVHRVCSR